MNKNIKALGLIILGLIICLLITYIAIAFLKVETNPFIWKQEERGVMLFIAFIYVCFSPLMFVFIKDEMN